MKRLAIPALVLAIGALAACGGNDSGTNGMDHGSSATASASSSSAAAVTAHNAADVTFAQEMIVHHRGAIKMASLATSRASNSEVKALASKIQQAQQPEIDTMSDWLTAWGEKIPAESAEMDHGSGDMDMGSSASPMPGGMTDEQMAALEKASGKEFDTMFLNMMIEHHNGAITMAKTEQSAGQNTAAKTLAGKIIADQSAEITQMRTLLQTV
ncbi:DUF305 domain-containing protein [Cryptosporangium minutisporangium]|uniref:DUF305 domain-containing protein n=1 Tax=Cryptosporangium minutisporangium TaxID=113569 RepID=A0ABP6T334_9ACTN